ncbi:hypothetical protein M0R45_015465 [Rubus argutus]|uniref:Leucine-rich repeat-containing N-terminal plant-type domain-containing protein n=1 Tax=Rubus argutus TaxID=59490 RepID=A0AAW1XRR5_RUBAR
MIFLMVLLGRTDVDSWTKDEDCCAWSGVTCEGVTGHVTGLDLSSVGLQGILHSNSSLFSLGHLEMLDLSSNDFMGSSISSKFGGFVSMTYLYLMFSNFTGRIPSEISHLSKLVELFLSSGKTTIDTLSMKRIAQNLTTLEVLYLDFVDMSSVVPADAFLNLFSSLTSLSLTLCNLHGKFPETIFHLPNLESLNLLQNTNLTGSTPKSNWSSPLKSLALSSTKISIDLHILTSNLKSLEILRLQECNFVGSHLELSGNLTQLMGLDLSGNSFVGLIPWSLLNLERLILLDLSNNMLVGELPEIQSNSTNSFSSLHDSSKKQLVGSIPVGLNMLNLDNNSLNGTIPSWVYSLPSLEYLWLSHNQFSGNIKAVFQSLSLSYLDISSNNLSGVVEFEKFRKLRSLTLLDISHNQLMVSFQNFSNYTMPKLDFLHMSSCHITQFPYFLRTSPQLTSLDLSDNQIQGNVPTWLLDVGIDSLSYCILSHNFLTGTIEQFMWKNIAVLDLRSNLLAGKLPIPSPSTYFYSMSNNHLTGPLASTLCNLTSLKVIDLSTNSLSGKIPQCIGTFSRHLSVLDLHMNQFLGKIPSTFPKGNILRNLNLRGNRLEGALPQSLINCRKMEVLDLGDNKINDTFPNWLESLLLLQVLILRSNRLYGPIGNPKTRFPFQKLRIMDLSHNQFGGPLPIKYFKNLLAMTILQDEELKYMGDDYYQDNVIVVMKDLYVELVKLQTMFTTIDFSNNAFRGEIPRVIGELKSLKGLNFSSNKLTGLMR